MPELLERTLAREGLQQLERDGYYVARGLFSPAEATQLRDAFMSQASDGPVEGLSEFKCGDMPTYDSSDPLAFYPRMMNPHCRPDLPVGPLAQQFMLDGRLKPILEEGLGEEPLAVQSMFYFKPPGARGQALHQDNFYLRVAPGTCMAAWVAVDDADEENGGMVVVPGSNRMDVACPEKADSTRFFTSDYVGVPAGCHEEAVRLKAGDVLFFNGSLIHGSNPNTSEERFRRALIFHYVPRFSQELSEWYKPVTFDGEAVGIAPATGGGPCGIAQPVGPH